MKLIPTRLDGPLLIEPAAHGDARGFFVESYRTDALAELGVTEAFVQDNHSRSAKGVVRGIHFATGNGQAKLVRCARGAIVDVLVDLRAGSPTFGEWEAFELNDESLQLLYAPIGFGHGFCVTSEVADVAYKLSSYYSPDVERGFAFNDPEVGIVWPSVELLYSERDATAPRLSEIAADLPFTYAG